MKTLTLTQCRKLLKERFGGILKSGKHSPDGQVCIRELRAVALELPWSDHPDGDSSSPTDRACQILNDAVWSSDGARTEHCLPLALLSESAAPLGWVKKYAESTIRVIVPIALRAAAKANPAHAGKLEDAAKRCEKDGDQAAAAARAAAAAAEAAGAARDRVLQVAVTLLIDSHKN